MIKTLTNNYVSLTTQYNVTTIRDILNVSSFWTTATITLSMVLGEGRGRAQIGETGPLVEGRELETRRPLSLN